MGINAALKCYMGTYRLLRVIPKQALANEPEKSGYKTKQDCASTTRRSFTRIFLVNILMKMLNDVGKLGVSFPSEHWAKAGAYRLGRRSEASGMSPL
jgi:hypothetical protein